MGDEAGQGVGEPVADLHEQALLLRRPGPGVGALVHAGDPRRADLRVDGHREDRPGRRDFIGNGDGRDLLRVELHAPVRLEGALVPPLRLGRRRLRYA
jgi:hypothetical protein